MEIFLVQGQVRCSYYMQDDQPVVKEVRLVRAATAVEARVKFEKYWEDQGSAYSHSYYVLNCEVLETVE